MTRQNAKRNRMTEYIFIQQRNGQLQAIFDEIYKFESHLDINYIFNVVFNAYKIMEILIYIKDKTEKFLAETFKTERAINFEFFDRYRFIEILSRNFNERLEFYSTIAFCSDIKFNAKVLFIIIFRILTVWYIL